MKERIDLNSNGLCIESSGRILKNGKVTKCFSARLLKAGLLLQNCNDCQHFQWVKRYILCKKPCDVSVPILYVYKSKKDRQANNSKTSLVLQNYVGFESGECQFKHILQVVLLFLLNFFDICHFFTLQESRWTLLLLLSHLFEHFVSSPLIYVFTRNKP